MKGQGAICLRHLGLAQARRMLDFVRRNIGRVPMGLLKASQEAVQVLIQEPLSVSGCMPAHTWMTASWAA